MNKQLKLDESSSLLLLGKQPSGIYFLTILGNKRILFSEKIVIQK